MRSVAGASNATDDCGCSNCGCQSTERSSTSGWHCLSAADALLVQAAAFVLELDDVTYSRSCPLACDSSIGKHLRHCIDHFVAIVDALASAATSGERMVVDYDHRERDVPMETCRQTAIATIAVVRSRLAVLDASSLDCPVLVRAMLGTDGCTTDLGSTLARELAFATHHAVHHHALMAFIAAAFGQKAPANFGKAPSTSHHERTRSCVVADAR